MWQKCLDFISQPVHFCNILVHQNKITLLADDSPHRQTLTTLSNIDIYDMYTCYKNRMRVVEVFEICETAANFMVCWLTLSTVDPAAPVDLSLLLS